MQTLKRATVKASPQALVNLSSPACAVESLMACRTLSPGGRLTAPAGLEGPRSLAPPGNISIIVVFQR